MDLSLKTQYEITSADTDMYGRLRSSSLVNFLIQSAIKSADILGFGFDEMNRQNLFWVLSRLSLKIDKTPNWKDLIMVETWPKDIEKILYLRDYIVWDEEGEIVARASSGWLSVDREKKRPKQVESINIERFTKLKDKHALVHLPEKLAFNNGDEKFVVKTSFFDFDLNQHVTSCRYIDWVMDTFTKEFHKVNYPNNISINFLHEIKPESKIAILREKISENEYIFEGKNLDEGTIAFRTKILFSHKNRV